MKKAGTIAAVLQQNDAYRIPDEKPRHVKRNVSAKVSTQRMRPASAQHKRHMPLTVFGVPTKKGPRNIFTASVCLPTDTRHSLAKSPKRKPVVHTESKLTKLLEKYGTTKAKTSPSKHVALYLDESITKYEVSGIK